MSRIIELLQREHHDLDQLLGFLERQLDSKRQETEVDYELIYDVMYYISRYPDRFHHPKEDLIYRKLCERDPSQLEYVNALLNDHQMLAVKSLAFFEAIRNVLNDSIQSFTDFFDTAGAYIKLQRAHISKEEQEVFPLVLDTLRQEDWKAIHDDADRMMSENKSEYENMKQRRRMIDRITA